MYSRNRVSAAEQRYAENLPPVYGGSRFYRGAVPAVKERTPLEAEPAVTPAAGIPVEYEVRTGRERDIPRTEGGESAPAVRDTETPVQEEAVSVSSCAESVREEDRGEPERAVKASREGGLASLLAGDSEEVLLIVLILLLGGEAERAADVIVILLLLLVLR